MRSDPTRRPWMYGLAAVLLATQAGCASRAPEGEAAEQVDSTVQALTSCSAAPGSVSCVPGEAVPEACGAAPCLLDDSSQTCCIPPPPIAEVSTPGAGNICVSTTLVRTSGAPNEKTFTFNVPCPSSAEDRYTIVVNNGSGTASLGASAAWIALNGKQVLSPKDVNNQVQHIEIPATLVAGPNTLTVRLASTPGSSVTVGIRKAPFQIAVSAPLPGQCLGELPTVPGTTNDACIAVSSNGKAGVMAGNAFTVASVPLVEGEQADLLTSGVDWCGNTSTDDRKVIYDITQPVIDASGFAAGEITNQDVTPTFTVSDPNLVERTNVLTLTTGSASQPRGAADTTTTIPFESGQTLSAEGDYTLSIHGADCAANAAELADQTFTIDKTPPQVVLAGVSSGQQIRDASVTPTFTVADRNLASASATLSFTPSGSSAAQSSAFISGTTLSAAGSYALTVAATDQAGNSATHTLQFSVALCGNSLVEPGEQCEKAACCPACDVLPDSTACPSTDPCFEHHTCQAGICTGDTPTEVCSSTQLNVAASSPSPQTFDVGGADVTVAENTTITVNGVPVQGSVPLSVGDVQSSGVVLASYPAALPPNFDPIKVFHLEPSGAQFSPPLVFSITFDPNENTDPAFMLCNDAGTTCEQVTGTVSSVVVNGVTMAKMDVPVAHFSWGFLGNITKPFVAAFNATVNAVNTAITMVNDSLDFPDEVGNIAPFRPSWMGDIYPWIKDKRLKEIMIPGTHDSGAYNMAASYSIPLAQAQDSTFAQQLEQGVRYFDIRVGGPWSNNLFIPLNSPLVLPSDNFMLVHGAFYTRVPLRDLLNSVTNFLNQYPKEIVIVKFSHFSGFGAGSMPGNRSELYQRIHDAWGSRLIPPSQTNSEIEDLVMANQRVLAMILDGTAPHPSLNLAHFNGDLDSGNPFPIGATEFQSKYFDKMDLSLMDDAAFEVFKPHSGIWVLQAQGTPKCSGGLPIPFSMTCLPPISALANRFNPLVDVRLRNSWRTQANIVQIDFSRRSTYVDAAINANLERGLGPNSYQQSCSDCSYSNNQLSCKCDTGYGGTMFSSVPLPCNTDIANCNGDLTCGPCMPMPPGMPPGTYKNSCTGCSANNNQLSCTCSSIGASSPDTTSSVGLPCNGDIANCDGYLTCGGC